MRVAHIVMQPVWIAIAYVLLFIAMAFLGAYLVVGCAIAPAVRRINPPTRSGIDDA